MPLEAPTSKTEYLDTLAAFDAEVTRLTREHKRAIKAKDDAKRVMDQQMFEASMPKPSFLDSLREVAACQRAAAEEQRNAPPPRFASAADEKAYYKNGDPRDPNAFVKRRMRGSPFPVRAL